MDAELYVLQPQLKWLRKFAERVPNGGWRCKRHGTKIVFVPITRTVWDRGFKTKVGDVVVLHLSCPTCTPHRTPVHKGDPVFRDGIAKVNRDFALTPTPPR